MKKPRFIYRFFASFLTIAVLFSAILPAALTGKALAEEFCSIFGNEQPMHTATEMCSAQAKNMSPDKTTAKEKQESCTLTYVCCCIDKAPAAPKTVPVSQNVSFKIVGLPISTIGHIAYSSQLTSSIEHKFLKASDSSPPIFLKNSSFLN